MALSMTAGLGMSDFLGALVGRALRCFAAARHDKRSGVARALPHPVTLSAAKGLRSWLAEALRGR